MYRLTNFAALKISHASRHHKLRARALHDGDPPRPDSPAIPFAIPSRAHGIFLRPLVHLGVRERPRPVVRDPPGTRILDDDRRVVRTSGVGRNLRPSNHASPWGEPAQIRPSPSSTRDRGVSSASPSDLPKCLTIPSFNRFKPARVRPSKHYHPWPPARTKLYWQVKPCFEVTVSKRELSKAIESLIGRRPDIALAILEYLHDRVAGESVRPQEDIRPVAMQVYEPLPDRSGPNPPFTIPEKLNDAWRCNARHAIGDNFISDDLLQASAGPDQKCSIVSVHKPRDGGLRHVIEFGRARLPAP